MKVAGWMQSSSVPITSLLCSAYSDTAAVTSCTVGGVRIREVVNCNKFNKVLSVLSCSYTAPTALGTKFEQIRANVFFIKRF